MGSPLALPHPPPGAPDETGACGPRAVQWTLPDGRSAWRWELRRNCALTPLQMLMALGLLAGLSGLVAAAGALLGSWMALLFVLPEWLAIAVALVVHARHAGDRELLTLQGGRLVVERREAGRTECCSLDIAWLSVGETGGSDPLIGLRTHGRTLAVGRHLSRPRRLEVLRELRLALVQARRQAGRLPASGLAPSRGLSCSHASP